MRNALKYLVAFDLIFVVALAISGMLEGVISEIIYYLAFLVPICLSLLLLRREGREETRSLFRITGKNLALSSLTFMPAVLIILLISYLTSLLLGIFGASAPTVEDAPILEMLLIHALLPALLEEMLFRFVPLRLLKGYSTRTVVVISALFFASVHCSLFQIPYAFAAGLLFVSLDIIFDSVYPSLILHFLNNALSVISIKYCDTPTASTIYLTVLISLGVLSAVLVYRLRKEYQARFYKLQKDGERADIRICLPLVLPTFAVAILNLL